MKHRISLESSCSVEGMVWIRSLQCIGLSSSSSGGMGVPCGVAWGGAILIRAEVGLVGVNAMVFKWSSWSQWLSPGIGGWAFSEQLNVECMIWVWGLKSIGLSSGSGSGMGVPC